jgi:hypothetical protein
MSCGDFWIRFANPKISLTHTVYLLKMGFRPHSENDVALISFSGLCLILEV